MGMGAIYVIGRQGIFAGFAGEHTGIVINYSSGAQEYFAAYATNPGNPLAFGTVDPVHDRQYDANFRTGLANRDYVKILDDAMARGIEQGAVSGWVFEQVYTGPDVEIAARARAMLSANVEIDLANIPYTLLSFEPTNSNAYTYTLLSTADLSLKDGGFFTYPGLQVAPNSWAVGYGNNLLETPSCFPAGTMISLASGHQKAIESIVPGDVVAAFDPHTSPSPALQGKQVVRLFHNATDIWVAAFSSGRPVCARPPY